jgi:uncharacterized membrane protein YdjX (TVP38/TMEM64 family)
VLRGALESGLMLVRGADTRAFPMIVAAVALAATLSMSVPFASLLVAAVLMSPRRWATISLWSSGAALGSAVLYLVFHHLGWARLFEVYPDVVASAAWRDATAWLARYGIVALLVIAATPLPLTPALMFAAISRLPVAEVILALWVGKLVKYLVYAWLASSFPARWITQVHLRLLTVNAVLGRADRADGR